MSDLTKLYPFLTRKDLAFDQSAVFSLEVNITGIDTGVLNVIGFTREGIFKFRLTHSGDGTAESTQFRIPDFPTMVSLFCTQDSMDRGEMWGELWLRINGERVFRYGSGYISAQTAISWPSQVNETEMPGRGFLTRVAGTNPAAGAEISETVPANETWLLHAVAFQFVTDGTAANRNVHLTIQPTGTGRAINIHGNIVQAASTTNQWNFAPYSFLPSAADNGQVLVPMPPNLFLIETGVIATETTLIKSGDQFSFISLYVEKFMKS